MRNNQPITGREHPVQPGERLISTTDCNSLITGANDDFIRVAGFTREELVGNPHNIVRHPDMPPAAFDMLWKTLKQGKAWMGVVKNRCKNGDHYIVDAYVTPIYENQQVVGYQSVRTWADPKLSQRATRIYASLSRGKKLSRLSLKHQPLALKAIGVGLIAGSAGRRLWAVDDRRTDTLCRHRVRSGPGQACSRPGHTHANALR